MYQFITAAIGFAAGAFVWSGDPIVGILLAICAMVWIAITTTRVPKWAARLHQPTFVAQLG